MNDGIPVPFFGHPAMTAPALAVLALRFDCDVVNATLEEWIRDRPSNGSGCTDVVGRISRNYR
jgi:lauroyl/myristoyl acyltransferase